VLVTLVAAVPGGVVTNAPGAAGTASSRAGFPVPGGHGTPIGGSPAGSTYSPVPSAHATSSATDWNSSPDCQSRLAAYEEFYGARLPTDVRHTLQSPCYIGHDEPALNFLSNDSSSGSRVRFVVDLPAAGTDTASAFAVVWFGMWLHGVPCSYDGLSYLEVQLNPPYSTIGLDANANWTLQAPVWDLVPAGSCDPQCQNDTAFATIEGVGYCEDDAAISGPGTYTPSGWGNFAQGDELVVDLVGAAGGSSPLSVYVNDTTHPGADLAWTYSAAVTATGLPLTPAYDAASWTSAGWGYGLDVAVTWENCPEPAAADYPTACNSYDEPAVEAVGVPTLRSATYWNASVSDYTNPYPWTATTSSAGGCSGVAAPCQDFLTYGGTGFYPYWSLQASGGTAWWVYGGRYADQVTDWGGAAGEFTPEGYIPVVLDPTGIGSVENATGAGTVTLTTTVADPNGVTAVSFNGYFCSSSSTATLTTTAGTLAGGPGNTSFDGLWSASFSTGGYSGTFHYAVRSESSSGVWSSPVGGAVAIAGGTSCGFTTPPAPVFTVANVTPIGGGYALTWTDASSAITNYTVWFNATTNGTPFPVEVGSATAVHLDLGAGDTAFTIAITATDASGRSARTPPVTAPSTLASLTATLTGPASPNLVVAGAPVPFTFNASGGEAPYTFAITFGDGTNATVASSSPDVNLTHDFGAYFGGALVLLNVTDALGDVAFAAPLLLLIQATPLGVPQTVWAGDGLVNVTFLLPASPAAPVTKFTVFYTESAEYAYALTSIWPNNASAYDLHLWNTSRPWFNASVPNGVTFYAQVVAWNAYGEGLLPNGSAFLVATPAPLVVGPILGGPGGPAPYVDPIATWITNGTNDPLDSAFYTIGTTLVTADQAPGAGGVWLNATITFPTAGLQVVVLHVADVFSDIGIGVLDVLVTPGAGPGLVLIPPTLNGWFGYAGSAIRVDAEVVGGTGPFDGVWSFGDGATGEGLNVTHTYQVGGNYTLSVTVTDNGTGGSTTRSQAVLIYALPVVSIATAPGPDGPLSWAFNAIVTGGSGATKVTWTFGDGTVGTGASIDHDYVTPGPYVVNVTALDPMGMSGKATTTINVAGAGTGTSSGNTFAGLTAATWGPLAVGLGILVVVLLVVALVVRGRSRGPTAIAPTSIEQPSGDGQDEATEDERS